jgi:hypothetical protein
VCDVQGTSHGNDENSKVYFGCSTCSVRCTGSGFCLRSRDDRILRTRGTGEPPRLPPLPYSSEGGFDRNTLHDSSPQGREGTIHLQGQAFATCLRTIINALGWAGSLLPVRSTGRTELRVAGLTPRSVPPPHLLCEGNCGSPTSNIGTFRTLSGEQ